MMKEDLGAISEQVDNFGYFNEKSKEKAKNRKKIKCGSVDMQL